MATESFDDNDFVSVVTDLRVNGRLKSALLDVCHLPGSPFSGYLLLLLL
jgi:hypothetical protein